MSSDDLDRFLSVIYEFDHVDLSYINLVEDEKQAESKRKVSDSLAKRKRIACILAISLVRRGDWFMYAWMLSPGQISRAIS
jgi:hypothetical protein